MKGWVDEKDGSREVEGESSKEGIEPNFLHIKTRLFSRVSSLCWADDLLCPSLSANPSLSKGTYYPLQPLVLWMSLFSPFLWLPHFCGFPLVFPWPPYRILVLLGQISSLDILYYASTISSKQI